MQEVPVSPLSPALPACAFPGRLTQLMQGRGVYGLVIEPTPANLNNVEATAHDAWTTKSSRVSPCKPEHGAQRYAHDRYEHFHADRYHDDHYFTRTHFHLNATDTPQSAAAVRRVRPTRGSQTLWTAAFESARPGSDAELERVRSAFVRHNTCRQSLQGAVDAVQAFVSLLEHRGERSTWGMDLYLQAWLRYSRADVHGVFYTSDSRGIVNVTVGRQGAVMMRRQLGLDRLPLFEFRSRRGCEAPQRERGMGLIEVLAAGEHEHKL